MILLQRGRHPVKTRGRRWILPTGFLAACIAPSLLAVGVLAQNAAQTAAQSPNKSSERILPPPQASPGKTAEPGAEKGAEKSSQSSSDHSSERRVLIRDVASVEGIRNNSLIGYGLVVGLKGTGDKQQTYFTIQTLASILQRMGVEIPPSVVQSTVQVKNVAAVFVTANLPPFSRPGMPLDVNVSSAGDARSLEGGLLLLTPLYAADGLVYASAQGPVATGGYAVGSAANSKQVNQPNVGRIPNGGLVERDSSLDLTKLRSFSILLNEASFTTAEEVAAVIDHELGSALAVVVDSRRIELQIPVPGNPKLPALLARIEDLEIRVHRKAKVVINERTGTVVMGQDVRLGAVSILHGSFSIEVSTTHSVSQPNPLAAGQTEVVAETSLKTSEGPARNVQLSEGASVEELVSRLQAIGATARDVISILQAIKAAGSLEAELEVI
jgi:flagellar P-ring protein precursor FlgI